MNYEQKYLKYKNKYLELRNQIGGWKCTHCNTENEEARSWCKHCEKTHVVQSGVASSAVPRAASTAAPSVASSAVPTVAPSAVPRAAPSAASSGTLCTCGYCNFKRTNGPKAGEIEVFRLTPIVGRCYEYVFANRSIFPPTNYHNPGEPNNRLYYTTSPYIYAGRFVSGHTQGYGDGSTHYDIFDNNGTQVRVDYDYEGNLCFREVPCK